MITLIGIDLAKKGQEFVFLGPAKECEDCKYSEFCQRCPGMLCAESGNAEKVSDSVRGRRHGDLQQINTHRRMIEIVILKQQPRCCHNAAGNRRHQQWCFPLDASTPEQKGCH